MNFSIKLVLLILIGALNRNHLLLRYDGACEFWIWERRRSFHGDACLTIALDDGRDLFHGNAEAMVL